MPPPPSGTPIVNKAPHPNAVKVYVDWLLSKAGQDAMVKASGYASRRLDASTGDLPPYVVPKPGVTYQDNSAEDYAGLAQDVIGLLKTVMPSQ